MSICHNVFLVLVGLLSPRLPTGLSIGGSSYKTPPSGYHKASALGSTLVATDQDGHRMGEGGGWRPCWSNVFRAEFKLLGLHFKGQILHFKLYHVEIDSQGRASQAWRSTHGKQTKYIAHQKGWFQNMHLRKR